MANESLHGRCTGAYGQTRFGNASGVTYAATNAETAVSWGGAGLGATPADVTTFVRGTVVSSTKITINRPGKYFIRASISYAGNNGNTVTMQLRRNQAAMAPPYIAKATALTGCLNHQLILEAHEWLNADDSVDVTLLDSNASENLTVYEAVLRVWQEEV